jgi:hypothetical protein
MNKSFREKLLHLLNIKNSSEENIEAFHKLGEEITKNFEHRSFKVGDKVQIDFNACGSLCKCFWDKTKAPYLKEEEVYEVEDTTEFGGGCPPLYLILKGVNQNNNRWLPANWFKVISSKNTI